MGAVGDVDVALREQQEELAALVSRASTADLSRPSRCPGWTVADVLLHLAQTNEMAVASVAGRLDEFTAEQAAGLPATAATASIDDLAGALVDLQRTSPDAALERWETSAAAQLAAFATVDPAARVRWVAGELAARTLATTRLTETWIHTVDIAVAFGPAPPSTDRLWHTARLVWRTVPYALHQGGVTPAGEVAFVLDAPDGTPWTFGPDAADTVVRGSALDLCTVAGQRDDATNTSLRATGPDGPAVLRLMRTFA